MSDFTSKTCDSWAVRCGALTAFGLIILGSCSSVDAAPTETSEMSTNWACGATTWGMTTQLDGGSVPQAWGAGVEVPVWLETWLDNDSRGWENRDLSAYEDAFSEDAIYYTSAFVEPLRGREEILSHIDGNLGSQQDITYRYEVLDVHGLSAIVRWCASYTLPDAGQEQWLDGLSFYDFDKNGRVARHREWTAFNSFPSANRDQ